MVATGRAKGSGGRDDLGDGFERTGVVEFGDWIVDPLVGVRQLGFELESQAFSSGVEPSFDGSERRVVSLCDFEQAVSLDIECEQRAPIHLTEFGESAPEACRAFAIDHAIERVVAGFGETFEDFVIERCWMGAPGGAIDRQIGGDLADPACETFGLAKLVESCHGVEEDVLCELLGLGDVSEPAQADRVDGWLEFGGEFAIGLAIAGLRVSDQSGD